MEFNIRFRLAGYDDVPQIAALIAEAQREITDGSYVAGGDEKFVEEHIERQGFCIIAEAVWKTDNDAYCNKPEEPSNRIQSEFAGFLIVRFPGLSEDNLGRALNMTDEELLRVAHVEESVVVKKFRGNHIEKLLFGEMDKYVDKDIYKHIMVVISPNNPASLKSAMDSGFSEVARTNMYHGVERVLLDNR